MSHPELKQLLRQLIQENSNSSDKVEMPSEFVSAIVDAENRVEQRTIPRSFFVTEFNSYC